MTHLVHRKTFDLSDNEDWQVTKAIYSIGDDTNDSLCDDGHNFEAATLRIPVSIANTIALRIERNAVSKNSESEEDGKFNVDPCFRYCISSSIDDPPMVEVCFNYNPDPHGDDEYDASSFLPESLSITLLQYPKFWPQCYRGEWTQWINEKTHIKLFEMRQTFAVCEFIEHESMRFFNMVDDNSIHGYSAILFDDSSFHSTDEKWDTDCRRTPSIHEINSSSNLIFGIVTDVRSKFKYNAQTPVIDKYVHHVLKRNWKTWFTYTCPICFCVESCDEGVELRCGHFFCEECISMYIKTKLSELHLYRQNPFICPLSSCKQDMNVIAQSEKKVLSQKTNHKKKGANAMSCFIDDTQRKQIVEWKKNLDHPISRILQTCPRIKCKAEGMRRLEASAANSMVFCESCDATFCELCLQKQCNKTQISDVKDLIKYHECDDKDMLKLCRKYRHASEDIRQKARRKWHWLHEYAEVRESDLSANLWVKENATKCPTCSTAIERAFGCFHMHCTQCGTHFCYECGCEIFHPFYGTHNCWEDMGWQAEDEFGGFAFFEH